jgi:predicted RNA methylase
VPQGTGRVSGVAPAPTTGAQYQRLRSRGSLARVSVHVLPKVLEYHGDMLADPARVGAFRRAIEARVAPGAVVLDLGGGTGVLSALACRAGARRVYMMEAGPVIDFARELLKANGLAERVVTLHGQSIDSTLPEPIDVIISETIGVAAFDEGILSSVLDARRRFGRPGSPPVVIPGQLAMWAAPVSDPALHERLVGRWGAPLSEATGYDVRTLRARAPHHLYIRRVMREHLVAPGVELARVDLATLAEPFVEGTARFPFERGATVHGLAVWFEAELAPGIVISNAPVLEANEDISQHWSHGFLPLSDGLVVGQGETLELTVQVNGGDLWRWCGGVAGGARFDQCTAFGAPLDQIWSPATKPG